MLFKERCTSSIMRTPSCVYPADSFRVDNGASGTGHARPNEFSTQWLRQYAAIANTYWAKVMACQALLKKERE